MTDERIKAFIRLLIAAILFFNTIATALGVNPIPFDESAFAETMTYVLQGAAIAWVWWKNNNVTKAAGKAQQYLKALKEDGEPEETEEPQTTGRENAETEDDEEEEAEDEETDDEA